MTKNEFIQSLVKDIIMVHVESNYTIDTRLVQKIVSTASCVAEDVEHVAPFDKEPVKKDKEYICRLL